MNRRKLTHGGFRVADSVVLVCSLYLAADLFAVPVEWLSLQDDTGGRSRLLDITSIGILLVVWQILFPSFGLYRQRYLSFMSFKRYRLIDLVKATSLGTLL